MSLFDVGVSPLRRHHLFDVGVPPLQVFCFFDFGLSSARQTFFCDCGVSPLAAGASFCYVGVGSPPQAPFCSMFGRPSPQVLGINVVKL